MTLNNNKHKAYPKYKPSGIDWIGDIPQHWEIKKIKRITKSHKQGYYTEQNYIDTGVKLVRITDIDDKANYSLEKCPCVEISEKDTQIFLIEDNDFLFARTGGVGLFAFVNSINEKAVFASYLIRFKFCELGVFLKYVLLSNYFNESLRSDLHGGVNQNVHAENIKNQIVTIPPLSEQQQIADYLDRQTSLIDEAITKQERLISVMEEKRTTIINNAVTKGLDPNVKMKPSGIDWIGDIPQHWEIKKLKYISSINGRIGFRGYTTDDLVDEGNGALTIGATHINEKGFIDLSSPVYISWFKYYESPEIMIRKNDILLVQRGVSTCGKVGFIKNDIGEATINPSLILLKNIKCESIYLFYFLKCNYTQSIVSNIISNTAIPMLSQEQLSRFIVILPPLSEQQQIADYLDRQTSLIDEAISKSNDLIERMKEKRTALISAVVCGKIDVRDYQEL